MSKKNWPVRLDHILECIQNIETYLKGKKPEDLLGSQMMMDAIERNFEIIGEATRHIPEDIKKQYPETPWSDILGMRNVLAHGYQEVSHTTLWNTANEELKTFRKTIEKIKASL